MSLAVPDRLTWETLRELLQSIEPAALLVEPRILRRVIRLDRRLAGLGLFMPHRKTYTIERDRLLAFVDWAELELPPGADLPRSVILIARVTNETLETVPAEQSIRRCLRLLFHARVHLELGRRLEGQPTRELAEQRKQQLGEIEFAEIRSVLMKEELLFPEPSDLDTYIEFAAVYLELRYFAEHDLKRYFPAIRDWAEVDRIISQDVYHSQLFDSMRQLPGGVRVGEPAEEPAEQLDEPSPMPVPTPWKSRQLETRARRAATLGNSVKAAIQLTRAASYALPERTAECHAAADRELRLLTKRLQPVLQLSDREVDTWSAALRPLLTPAARGFWSLEAQTVVRPAEGLCRAGTRCVQAGSDRVASNVRRPTDPTAVTVAAGSSDYKTPPVSRPATRDGALDAAASSTARRAVGGCRPTHRTSLARPDPATDSPGAGRCRTGSPKPSGTSRAEETRRGAS